VALAPVALAPVALPFPMPMDSQELKATVENLNNAYKQVTLTSDTVSAGTQESTTTKEASKYDDEGGSSM